MIDFRLVLVLASGSFATLVRSPKRSETLCPRVSGDRRQVSDSHQIVSRRRELKDPTYQPEPAMTCLTQESNRLQPAEDFFDSFALALANGVARMTSRALVNRTATPPLVVLGDVRRHVSLSQVSHEAMRVISLV